MAGSLKVVVEVVAALASWGYPGADRQQIACLAEAVYHEARGESLMGQVAVANVIINRAQDPGYPKTPCAVIRQKKQFSYRLRKSLRIKNAEAWEQSVMVAATVYVGLIDDLTEGATHYFNPQIVSPRWRHGLQELAQIDDHLFLKK
jgi:N-acetylmuramoyl-L-alanine amidase